MAAKGSGASAPALQFSDAKKLEPFARNAQKHPPAQVTAIARSIERFGFAAPVLADKTGIIAGHGRVMAALKLYAEGKTLKLPGGKAIPKGAVPVLRCDGWSDEQRRAYILADNNLGKMAETDEDILRDELAHLSKFDDLLLSAGFDELKVQDVMDSGGGWSANLGKIEATQEHTGDLHATVKVKCWEKDQEAVKAAIARALKRLNLEGAELV